MTMTLADQAAMTGHDGQVASGKGPRAGRPKRRTFTAAYKARILAEYDALPDGSPSAASCCAAKRLYHSHIEHWRQQQRRRARCLPRRESRRRSAEAEELARLRAENKKLKARNHKLESDLGKTGPRWTSREKHSRCWRTSPAARTPARTEPGHRRAFPADGGASVSPAPAGCSGNPAPRCTGSAIPKPAAPPAERTEFRHPAELSPEKSRRVLAVLDSPRFADKSSAQAYAILLDEGCYLCSQATMYRLLRERGTSPASAAPRPPTRRGRNPSWSPTARTRSGPGTSRN